MFSTRRLGLILIRRTRYLFFRYGKDIREYTFRTFAPSGTLLECQVFPRDQLLTNLLMSLCTLRFSAWKSYIDLDLFRKAFAIRIWEIAVHVPTLILVKSMIVIVWERLVAKSACSVLLGTPA